MTTPRQLLLKSCSLLFGLGAGGFLVYWLINETGPVGWLVDLQMQLLGVGSVKLAALPLMFAVLLPSLALWPRALQRQGRDLAAAPKPITARVALCMVAAPALVGGLLYGVLAWIDGQDQQQPIVTVALTAASQQPPADTKFVELTAIEVPPMTVSWKEQSTVHAVTPLVATDWEPGQPITCFVYRYGSAAEQAERYQQIGQRTLPGKLARRNLPTYVTKEYSRHDQPLADPYWVLEPMSFVDGRVPASFAPMLTLILGGGVSMIMLLVVAIMKWRGPQLVAGKPMAATA